MIKLKLIYITINLIILTTIYGQDSPSIIGERLKLFNKQNFLRYIQFLGNDLLEGRGTGSTGGMLAAKFLAREFDKLGLKPIGDGKTYYQNIPMHGSKPLESSKLNLYLENLDLLLKLNDNYLLYQSGSQTYIPQPTQLVFVGYGIIAPEFDYNDYQYADVEGKVVVFIDGEPTSKESSFFNGELPSIYSYPEIKQKIAISRGARGSILIPISNFSNDNYWDKLKKDFSFEIITHAYSVSTNFSAIVNYETARLLFTGAKYSLSDIISFHANNSMQSFALKSKISFSGISQERDFIAQNVVGMVEGRDPILKDKFVIVSAHYDHLGKGPAVNGDSIYNGVFDNASGVGALLEIASAVSNKNISPKRSVIFLLVTGEECGLLGSKYYTDNPLVPLYKTIANVNIDGVASFDNFKSIIGIGSEFSTMKNFIERTAEMHNLKIDNIPNQFLYTEAFAKSDQVAFAIAGIPSILVTEGIDYVNISYEEGIKKHIEYATKYYHSPFDDLNLPINLNAVMQHIEVIYSLVTDLANNEYEPEWNKNAPFINARLRSFAERK
jgi:Zn-dependent M28 family amino/carboxypeptidase